VARVVPDRLSEAQLFETISFAFKTSKAPAPFNTVWVLIHVRSKVFLNNLALWRLLFTPLPSIEL